VARAEHMGVVSICNICSPSRTWSNLHGSVQIWPHQESYVNETTWIGSDCWLFDFSWNAEHLYSKLFSKIE